MAERQADPFDALRTPIPPLAPDPAFAADLRRRLGSPLPPGTPKERAMASSITTRPRNGVRHGDVSYITLVARTASDPAAAAPAMKEAAWSLDRNLASVNITLHLKKFTLLRREGF